MSQSTAFFTMRCGNGKRHPIPLFKGLELKNLLIIGEVRFKVLEDYVRQSLFFYKGRKNRKRENISLPIPKRLVYNKARVIQPYACSNIWVTRQSLLWQWRRAIEWFSQFDESQPPEKLLKSILNQDMV
jgi:hypothetical protein